MKSFEEKIIIKELHDIKKLLAFIKENKYKYFATSTKYENEFFNNYYELLYDRNKLLFNDKYIKFFDIITKAIDDFHDLSAFYEIRLLMETRIKYINNETTYDFTRSFFLCDMSKYLQVYAYYNHLRIDEYDKLLSYLFNNCDEIIDWTIMNGVLENIYVNKYLYKTIKKDYYSIITTYINEKIRNKPVLK